MSVDSRMVHMGRPLMLVESKYCVDVIGPLVTKRTATTW